MYPASHAARHAAGHAAGRAARYLASVQPVGICGRIGIRSTLLTIIAATVTMTVTYYAAAAAKVPSATPALSTDLGI